MEIRLEDGQWTDFYPLDACDELVPITALEPSASTIYGKYIWGTVGYSIAWAHTHADKDRLRERLGNK